MPGDCLNSVLGLETADTTVVCVETEDIAVAECSKGATVGADPALVVTTGDVADTDVGYRLMHVSSCICEQGLAGGSKL